VKKSVGKVEKSRYVNLTTITTKRINQESIKSSKKISITKRIKKELMPNEMQDVRY
jgi:hypothetical protein